MDWKKTLHHTYRFVNNIPLKDGKDAMHVNWVELTITNDAGRKVNTFAFVTNHYVDKNGSIGNLSGIAEMYK